MNIPRWLEPLLRWGLWLVRPKYLIGVFPVCISEQDGVLLIKKRLGAATGWQLPGGAKDYGTTIEDAACEELHGETGYIAKPEHLELACIEVVEPHRDAHIAYLVHRWFGVLHVHDTFEISEARWFPLTEAESIIYGGHRAMLSEAIRLWHRRLLFYP